MTSFITKLKALPFSAGYVAVYTTRPLSVGETGTCSDGGGKGWEGPGVVSWVGFGWCSWEVGLL